MEKLLALIEELDRRRIFRRLASVRDAIMVEVHLPGARWEVEFFADRHVEVEIFRSDGGVLSHADAEAALQRIFDDDDKAEARAEQKTPVPRQFLSG